MPLENAIEKKGMELTHCPKCGNDEFYRKGRVSGHYEYQYRFDGGEANNGGLHEGLSYKEQKTCFCSKCHHNLGALLK